MSEWKENIHNITEHKLQIEENKKSLKVLIEQTNNQSEIVNLHKNKLKNIVM